MKTPKVVITYVVAGGIVHLPVVFRMRSKYQTDPEVLKSEVL